MQHKTQILHTPGHYDFLKNTSEKDTWNSPRHSSRRAAQRERTTSSPPPLMSASDSSDGELDGEAAMNQCNLVDADQDGDEEATE